LWCKRNSTLPTSIEGKFKWAGNQEAVTVLGYRPTRP
jgi:hypothetical protein